MKDIALSGLLSSYGFEGANVEPALGVLYQQGLTRNGKRRIAVSKSNAVEEALYAAFARHCKKDACRASVGRGRVAVLVAPRHCEVCGGSDNRGAVEEMLVAMRRANWKKLLVFGGSPGTRNDFKKLCGNRIELRFVTEKTRPNKKKIRSLLDWSDIAVVWASTEIPHAATDGICGNEVLTVPRRGVAALAIVVRDRCRGVG